MRRRGGVPRGSILKKTDESQTESEKPNANGGTLVSKLDIDFMKQSFSFFDVAKRGYLENYELGIFLNSKRLPLNQSSYGFLNGRREDKRSPF